MAISKWNIFLFCLQYIIKDMSLHCFPSGQRYCKTDLKLIFIVVLLWVSQHLEPQADKEVRCWAWGISLQLSRKMVVEHIYPKAPFTNSATPPVMTGCLSFSIFETPYKQNLMILNTRGSIRILLIGEWMEWKVNIPLLLQKDHNLFTQVDLSTESHLNSENQALFFLRTIF